MQAVFLALKHFKQMVQNQTVLLRTDNSTVVAYVNRQGGTKSVDLCLLTWDLLLWCRDNAVKLIAAHIPGKRNVIADRLSRGQSTKHTEWTLLQEIVDLVFKRWERPHIDLFATHLNKRLPVYCSPIPDPEAEAVDALSMSWKGIVGYAFPPPILIPRVLEKVASEDCIIILIAPHWPRQSWFPLLLRLLISQPIKLPEREDLLSQSRGRIWHPDPTALNLVAWKLSRKDDFKRAFQSELLSLWLLKT